MEKDERQSGGPEQVTGSGESQRASRPAPGKVTRTSSLPSSRGPAVQRKAAAPAPGSGGPPTRSAWDHTMDPWMDAAHRGVTALVERGQDARPIQAKADARTPDAPAQLPGYGGGAEMPGDVRGKMEAAFGADFSSVRIHEGPQVEAMGALAYTQGTDLHFAPGQYQPGSQHGQELLGHELAHVVQQSQGRVRATTQAKGVDINDDAALEREADEMGARAARGQSVTTDAPLAVAAQSAPTTLLQRYTDSEGHTLPDPLEVTWGGDKFRLEFRRIQKQGEPAFECAVRYVGPHPVDGPFIQDNTQRLSTTIGPAKLQSTIVGRGATSVDIDLFADNTRVLRVADEVRFDDRPAKRGRQHALALKVNGKSVSAISLWVLDPNAKATDALPAPGEENPVENVFSAGPMGAIGNIVHVDLTLGAYRDRFRLTIQPRTADRAILGLSPLYRGQPLDGASAELQLGGAIRFQKVATGETSFAVALDGDGKVDLTFHDRVTTPADYDGGGPPESNRNHEVRVVGAAIGGEKVFSFRVRDGFPSRAGSGAGNDRIAASNALAVDGLKKQVAEGSFTQQLDAYENAMTAQRKKAVDAGVLQQKTFDAWLALSRSLIRLRPQKPPVDAKLQAEAANQADAFYRAFAEETRSKDTLHTADGWWLSSNPYTGMNSGPAGTRGAGPELAGDLRGGRWEQVFRKYETLVTGLDRWIVDRLRETKGEAAPEAQQAELLAGRRRELGALEGKDAQRLRAVFHPDEKFKTEQGYVAEVPLVLYCWKEGSTWYLKNITNPGKPYHVTAEAKPGEAGPPLALFQELDDPDRLPAGVVHYDLPGGPAGEVRTTDGLTWAKFFAYLGLGLAGLGLTLATFGTGAVAVAGAWALAASAVAGSVSAGIDLADKAQHGDLDATSATLDIAQIVAGLAGATAIASGRIALMARNAPVGARWTGNWARLGVMANHAYVPATALTAGADVLSFAVISIQTAKQLDEIEARAGDDPAARARAKLLLLSQVAALGGLTALSVKGSLPNLTPGRTLVLHPGPDGVPVATLALDKNSLVVDTNVAVALDKRAKGVRLQPGEELALARMQKLGDVELRVTDTTADETAVKGFSPPHKGIPISVERTSQAYQDLLAELVKIPPVGRTKGVNDRNIVADTFFAVTEPGVTPRLATQDSGVYNPLAERAGIDVRKLGAELPKVKPDGFDVTIHGRTITVVPLPGRK